MLDPIAEVNDRVEELLLFRCCGDCSVHFEQSGEGCRENA